MEPIVIYETLCPIDPIRNRLNLPPHHLFRGMEEVFQVGFKSGSAIAFEQGKDSSLSNHTPSHFRTNILFDDAVADIGENEVPDILSEISFLVNLHRRNSQA